MIDRRLFIAAAGSSALAAPLALARTKPFVPQFGPRARVLITNDLAGDLDGLYATVHALLSPSTDLRAIVGTGTSMPSESASHAVAVANDILRMMKLTGKVPVHLGASGRIKDAAVPIPSPGTQAIIAEAMRTDTTLPLTITVGAGLTEVASALMIEPMIAGKFTLIWIGGGPPDNSAPLEYNFNIDPLAAMHVFNQSQVPIWQIPSDVYAQCMISASELQAHVAPHGEIGAWLYDKVASGSEWLRQNKLNTGENWTLGDSPLVLLTALTAWIPNLSGGKLAFDMTGSSRFDSIYVPELARSGIYTPRTSGRKMRLYRTVDTRMMFGDLFAKMQLNYGR